LLATISLTSRTRGRKVSQRERHNLLEQVDAVRRLCFKYAYRDELL
jgi:hypothetical protein